MNDEDRILTAEIVMVEETSWSKQKTEAEE